ncbi:MAG: hypothetical protein AAF840_17335 [Bacteroidota bacterium]
MLDNYSLNKDQGIDRLFISDVYRRDFSKDAPRPQRGRPGNPTFSVNVASPEKDFDMDRYYRMPGNYLVIPFGQIRNLNIIYTRLEEVTEE